MNASDQHWWLVHCLRTWSPRAPVSALGGSFARGYRERSGLRAKRASWLDAASVLVVALTQVVVQPLVQARFKAKTAGTGGNSKCEECEHGCTAERRPGPRRRRVTGCGRGRGRHSGSSIAYTRQAHLRSSPRHWPATSFSLSSQVPTYPYRACTDNERTSCRRERYCSDRPAEVCVSPAGGSAHRPR